MSGSSAIVTDIRNTNLSSSNAVLTNILNTNISSSSAIITNAVLTNGSIGTITITGTENSSSVTEGGSLVVQGGARIAKNLFIGGPSLQIPQGDTASRPGAPQQGYIRYNTEYSQFEGFGAGNAWGSLGGVSDIAQTTKILASASPGVTDGNLYFYNVGSENMRLNSAGNLGLGTTAPGYKLDVVGTLRASIGATLGSLNVTGASLLNGGLTAGSLLVTGGSMISSTEDASNGTSGGALTILGGAAVAKKLYANTVNITPSLGDISAEKSFTAANNVVSPANVTGFTFDNATVRSFNALASITIVRSAGGNLYANYEIKGIQKESGWVINSAYVGDATGITFSIGSDGQMKYESTNQANFTSSTIKFRALTTSI